MVALTFVANAVFSVVAANESAANENASSDNRVAQSKITLVTESKPQLEFGLAAAALQVPAYPSSSVTSKRQFLAPWFIYRSDKVQVKDGGVELVAYESDKLTVDLGLGASLNADTSETPLRDGMPDIDYLLELGPRFNVPLSDITKNEIRTRINWVSALRFAISTDFRRVDYRGPVLTTQLQYRTSGYNNDKLSFNVSVGSTFLGNQLMDYFYSVDPEFATDVRPAFNAKGGFLSLGLSAGIGYEPTPDINLYLGLGYNSLSGSKNEDSPLFEDDSNPRIILAAGWRLYKSKRLVSVREE